MRRNTTTPDPALADRPLSAGYVHDEIAATLAHCWDSQGQVHACFLAPTGAGRESVMDGSKASGSGNDDYQWLQTVEFTARLLPDGRPEPVRILVAGAKSLGGDSTFWIRAVLRPAATGRTPPWPLFVGGIYDGRTVLQTTGITSTTPAWYEMSGISTTNTRSCLDFPRSDAEAVARLTRSFERQGGIGTSNDPYEPASALLLAVDFYAGYSSGSTGSPAMVGYYLRACPTGYGT